MEAPEQQAISGGFMDESFSPDPVARPAEEVDKQAGKDKFQRIIAEKDRKMEQMQRPQQGQQPVVNMIDQSSKGGDSVQTSPVLANMASPFDNQDPMFTRRGVV